MLAQARLDSRGPFSLTLTIPGNIAVNFIGHALEAFGKTSPLPWWNSYTIRGPRAMAQSD
jgi:hypothetical protein